MKLDEAQERIGLETRATHEGAVDLDGRRVLAQVTGSGPRRTVSTGRPKVRGPLAADLIASTLRTLGPRLKSCHPAGALDRRAKLTLRFHVTEFGQVEEVTLVTNTHKGAVGRCVLGVARDWTFPPRAGRADTTVELPIHFGD